MALQRREAVLTLLRIIGLTGVLVGGALCPGLLQLLRGYTKRPFSYRTCYRAFHVLDANGWIKVRAGNRGIDIRLTKQGYEELHAYELGTKHLHRSGPWDGKWHFLIFDIEEKRKRLRDAVRRTLRSMGFHRLQDSVWVYPFDCREILELLRIRYGVRHEALYLCAETLDHDKWLQRHFEVKKELTTKKRDRAKT